MPQTPHELYLAGSGSFATEIAEWAQDAGWTVSGLVELLDLARVGSVRGGLPVLDPGDCPHGACAAIATGGDRSGHWTTLAEHGWQAATIVHPRAHVSSSAKLGAGCVVGPGAVIGAETIVAEHTADLEMPGDMYLLERMLRAGVRFAPLEEVVLDYYPSTLWLE